MILVPCSLKDILGSTFSGHNLFCNVVLQILWDLFDNFPSERQGLSPSKVIGFAKKDCLMVGSTRGLKSIDILLVEQEWSGTKKRLSNLEAAMLRQFLGQLRPMKSWFVAHLVKEVQLD